MTILRAFLIIAGLYLAGCFYPLPAAAEQADHLAGVNYDYLDQLDNLVTITSRKPVKGDEIITASGEHYRVVSVQGNSARVKLIGKDKILLSYMNYYEEQIKVAPVVSNQAWEERPVGIYHTHTDESYVPTDGKASIPFNGGIYQVGDMLNNTLKEHQVGVVYDETAHCPHDANAYNRSRRTAVKLMKQNPVAIFDVHRDGVDDPEFYRQALSEEDATQIRLVVGRQNPKMAVNLDFAKRLMAYVNKRNPKLIKEIYMAPGNYNQDLMSTALLLEAGTYTNEKPQAENGVVLLANAVPEMLGLTPPPGPDMTGAAETSKQGWQTAFFLVLLVAAGVLIYIFINYPTDKIKEYLSNKAVQLNKKVGLLHKRKQ